MAAKKLAGLQPVGIHTFLKVHVSENGKLVMKDEMKLIRLDYKILKRLRIPGFGEAQIHDLVHLGKTEWRYLGLDYEVRVHEIKPPWRKE